MRPARLILAEASQEHLLRQRMGRAACLWKWVFCCRRKPGCVVGHASSV